MSRTLELLREMERYTTQPGRQFPHCAICKRELEFGHDPDCLVGRAIAEELDMSEELKPCPFELYSERLKAIRKQVHCYESTSLANDDVAELLAMIRDVQLFDAIMNKGPRDIMEEAADVGNYAMMIHDLAVRSEKDTSPEPEEFPVMGGVDTIQSLRAKCKSLTAKLKASEKVLRCDKGETVCPDSKCWVALERDSHIATIEALKIKLNASEKRAEHD